MRSQQKGFPRWWEAKSRIDQETRICTYDKTMFGKVESGLRFERQASIMEIYGHVGYADGEKKVLWDLPGHGKAYGDCGSIKAKGCDHVEDHVNGKVFGRYFKRTCRRKQCPICFESWATSEGERAIIRLGSFLSGSGLVQNLIEKVKREKVMESKTIFHKSLVSELENLIQISKKKVIHVVLSPGDGEISEKAVDRAKSYMKARERAYQIAKKSGIHGGAIIFHPYRLKCSKCGLSIPDYNKECPQCHKREFKWFWSPHFHLVGFGWVQNTKEGYLEHGWVVKNLGVRRSVFWTFQYLLSHAGVSIFHTTTWFGSLAYNVLRHVAELGAVMEICPLCRRPLMPLTWIGLGPGPPIPEELSKDPYANEFLVEPGLWRHI